MDIATAKSLYDLISSALGNYSSQRRSYFAEHIQPLHEAVGNIHEDYIQGFSAVQKFLNGEDVSEAQVVSFLNERSRLFKTQRIYVVQMANALKTERKKVIVDSTWIATEKFCAACSGYLSVGNGVSGLSWFSHVINLIEKKRFNNTSEPERSIHGFDRQEFLRAIEQILNHELPEAYSEVAKRYTRLKVKMN